MSKDLCIHYAASGLCRLHKPSCAHHEDGVCRAEGKLEERQAAQGNGFMFGQWNQAPGKGGAR